MANQTYTTESTDRRTYIDRNDNRLLRMILPFVIGLALGWGANEMADNAKAQGPAGDVDYTESK